MRMRKILFVIGVVLFIWILGYVFIARLEEDFWVCTNNGWTKHGFPDTPMPTTTCSTVLKFVKTGFLIKDDGKTWNFVYEEPGKPSLMQKLDLSQAKCDDSSNCSLLKADDNVEIRGNSDGETIKVYFLKRLK